VVGSIVFTHFRGRSRFPWMLVVKFFAKLGFESFGSFFESGFCPRHVPDHCVQSFWPKDNHS